MSLDEETSDFVSRSTFDHPYPTTKIMWIPDSVSCYRLEKKRRVTHNYYDNNVTFYN